MALLRFEVHTVSGQIGIRVPCETNADTDTDADANFIAVEM